MANRFATTRWSLVLAAGGNGVGASTEALASLCELYWSPVYAIVRRQGYSVDDARDLTQEFFTRVLEKRYFSAADPDRGRFRAFLSTSVRHFLSNERDRNATQKRGRGVAHLSIEWESAEHRFQHEPRTELTPERLFDHQWSIVLLERVLSRLTEEYAVQGKRAQFDALKPYLTGDAADTGYKAAAEALNTSEGALKVAVHRLRRRFRDTLLDEIAETVSSPEQVDSEVRHLFSSLQL
jgi:RNA polymerase sigma factor (sigma-70 family)